MPASRRSRRPFASSPANCTRTSMPTIPRQKRSSARQRRQMRSSPTPSVVPPTTATDTRACAPGGTHPTSSHLARSATFSAPSSAALARGRGPPRGGDIAVAVEMTLLEASVGPKLDVSYEAIDRCDRCHGNGAEPGTPIERCSRCEGAGQVQSVVRTPFGQMMRTSLCHVCHGDGRVPTKPCGTCHGRGQLAVKRSEQITVPAGIDDGQRIRVSGRGHAGERGAPAGDLYVLVRVRADERFVREGDDLITALVVAAPLAALGATLEVPILDGAVPIELAAGTQPGEILTVRGQGMPSLRGGRRGNLRVVVNVLIPRRLSETQRELLGQLNETLTEENLRSEESMLGKLRRVLRPQA